MKSNKHLLLSIKRNEPIHSIPISNITEANISWMDSWSKTLSLQTLRMGVLGKLPQSH